MATDTFLVPDKHCKYHCSAHKATSSPLMNVYLTGPTALIFENEVEPQKDNKQLEGTVIHVSYVGMQTT